MDFNKRIKGLVSTPTGFYPSNLNIMFSKDKRSNTLSIGDERSGVQISFNLNDLKEIIKVVER